MEEADILIQRAETTLLQAELAAGADREALLQEAKDILIRAESVSPGSGSWFMACVNARMDNVALCQKWLERAYAAGALPTRDEMSKSPYMSRVRDERWFQRLLSRMNN